jgi:diguanylate cyclase (GGDEF)-like protein
MAAIVNDPRMTGSATVETSVAQAEGKLAHLQVQVEAMRAVLVRLLQDVVVAESRLAQSDAAKIVEANERMVLAAMAAQAEADTAAMALEDAQSSALRDPLTQLPNRSALPAQFAQATAHARRHRCHAALLFLDLDEFKTLNDTHGHAFGDQLLCLAANRMLSTVREVDAVSRYGGDEFLVLLADPEAPGDAQAVAEKLIAALGAPAQIAGQTVRLTASVGIAIYPEDGMDLETLIQRADAAMYEAKRRGGSRLAFHGKAPVATRLPPAPGADEPERRHALLRAANEKLVLAALTAQQLKAAAEQARQRQAAILAAVADELRNPQAPIRIAASMLGRLPGDEPLLPRVQKIFEQQMNEMTSLIGGLVDAAGHGREDMALDFVPVNLAHIIDECVVAEQATLVHRAQRLELARPPGPLTVPGDAPCLALIVGNLLDNASKHSHEGSSIGLSVAVGADTLAVTVSDQGIGITPELLPQIFEPFVQDTHAIGFNGTGMGIGLTVVQALVHAHGGQLVAHSAGVGRGSEFVVTLPLGTTGPPAPAGPGTAG